MTYPYEIEMMFGSEGAVSSPSLLFSSGFNPSPSPSGDLVKIISNSFEVTRDDGVTKKSAYSVVEIKKEDWTYLSENYPSSSYMLTIRSGEGEWSVVVFGMDGSTGGFVILFSEDTPTEESAVKCHLTTMSVKVYNGSSVEAIPIPSGTVVVKTYIDDEENNDDSYEPIPTTDPIPAHVEGDEPIVVDWLWQSEAINVSEHSSLVFKMAVPSVDPDYEDFIKGIESWQLVGFYDGEQSQYILTILYTKDGYNYSTSIGPTSLGYPTEGQKVLVKSKDGDINTLGFLKLQAFNSETGEEWEEDTFIPSGSVEINTTMNKI